MSTALAAPVVTPPPQGSLLRAEGRRLRSRRLVRLLVVLGVVAFVVGVGLASTQYARTTPAGLAQARQQQEQIIADQERFRQQCLAAQAPGDEAACPPSLTLEELGPVEGYLARTPFALDRDGRDGVLLVSVATAALAFLLGATSIGAEWSTRSLVALLFWQPRRLTVMGTKLGVLAAAAALLGVVAEAAWLLAARVLAGTRGTADVPDGTWSALLGSAGRGVLLVVLVGLLGFAVANLLRNTAAASGVAFVYFVLVENLLRGLVPSSRPYLLSESVGALVRPGGTRVLVDTGFQDGSFQVAGREVVVSNLQGGLVLAAATAVLVGAGVLLFVRRDLH